MLGPRKIRADTSPQAPPPAAGEIGGAEDLLGPAPEDSGTTSLVGSARPDWQKNLFRRVFSDQRYLVTRWWPQEIRRGAFAGPLAVALGGALQEPGADLRFTARAKSAPRNSGHRIAAYFTRAGNGAPVLVALGVTYLSARRAGNNRLAATTSEASEALLDAGIWILGTKQLFGRVRPDNPEAGRFLQYGKRHAGSFPSGHAMGAFAVATVFADAYRDKRRVPCLAYGGATLIAGSRLVLGAHFATDLIAGGVLGNSIGHMVRLRSGEDPASERGWRGRLTPIVGLDGRGIGLGFDFSRRRSSPGEPEEHADPGRPVR